MDVGGLCNRTSLRTSLGGGGWGEDTIRNDLEAFFKIIRIDLYEALRVV